MVWVPCRWSSARTWPIRGFGDRRRRRLGELGKLGDASAVPALVERLNLETDVFVRRGIARSLGELKAWEGVPALIDLLADDEVFVAMTAQKSLTKITGEKFGTHQEWLKWWEERR